MALRMRMFSCRRDITNFSSSPMLLISLSYGNIFAGSILSNISEKTFLVQSCARPSTLIASSLSRNRCPRLSTNLTNSSLLATKSVSQLTSSSIAFLRHGVTKEAITPSLVSLSALFYEVSNPFCFNHCIAFSQSHCDSSRAFLHSPIGALVSSLRRLIDSMGTLTEQKRRVSLANIIFNNGGKCLTK